jgi:hypothetical protein
MDERAITGVMAYLIVLIVGAVLYAISMQESKKKKKTLTTISKKTQKPKVTELT